MNKETRYLEFEIRAEKTEEKGSVITGQPIVFNQETDLGVCRETIDAGALDATDLRDVRFLVGHDFSMVPLARSRNNNENSTMQLMVNEDGMGIRVNLDTEGNPRAAELYSAIRRGDISGMSFTFTVDKDSWEGLDTEHKANIVEDYDMIKNAALEEKRYDALQKWVVEKVKVTSIKINEQYRDCPFVSKWQIPE